jgi:PAS domain S-box-containing protein
MTDSHVRLLVVDDEQSLRVPLKRYLERKFGYQVDAVGSSTAALDQAEAREGQYDVALIDEVLVEGLDGIETMQELQTLYPNLEVIIFTGWGASSKQRALRAGAFRYLEKPVNYDELAMVIRTAAQQVRLQEIGRLILTERDLGRVLEQITGAANSLALADETAIVLQEPHTLKLTVHAHTHSDGAWWRRHFVDRWASREIIDSSRVVWVPDTEGETGVHPAVIQAGVRSFLGVPIPGSDCNLGALYVYSNMPGRFEDWGTVSVLQTLAGHAGLALTNVNAFGQVRAQAIGMESLVQASRELTRATSLEAQLEITWDFVREQLQTSTYFVSLYDQSTDTVSFPLFYDECETVSIPTRLLGDDPIQWGTTGWVIKHGEELGWSSKEQQDKQCKKRGITPSTIGRPCQSCYFLPLTRGEQVIGVVSIQSYDQHAFDSVLLNTFRALGSQLVAAMENTRLLESEAKRRREAETLRETALTLTTTLEPHEIFERILSELQKVVPYDSASVQLLAGEQLRIIGVRGFPNPEQIMGLAFPLEGDNPNREVVRRRDWFVVADAPAVYSAFSEEPSIHAEIRAWLGVPMLVGDRLVGMIALDKHEPGFYTEEHAKLAQTFAAQAAVAIENSQLLEKAQQRARNLQTLQELALTLNSSLEPDETLQATCRAAVEFFGADHSGMVLFDRDLTKGRVLAEYPASGTAGTEIPLKGVLAEERLVKHKEALVFEDVAGEQSLGPVRDILTGFDIQSILIVPVVSSSGALVGSLSLDSLGTPRKFTKEEVRLCKVFAAHVAVAVENAQLFSRLGEAMQWREALVEHAFDSVIAIDEDKVITVFNKQAERLFGREAAEVLGRRRVGELYYDKDRAREVDQVLKQAGSVSGWEVEIRYRDGTPVPVLLSAAVLRDSDGNPIGQAGFMRDRRQVKLLESRLRALMTATQAVAGARVLDESLDRIVKAAVAAFPAALDGFIRLHDEQVDLLRLKASTHPSDHELGNALDLGVGEGIAGWVFQHRSPVNIADARQDVRYRRQRSAQLPPLKSIMCAPLQAQDRVIGTLSLENRDTVGAFEDQDLGLLRSFADQAAIVIVNTALFQETEESKENLKSLYEASSALISAQAPEQVLQDIVERARLAAEAWWAKVILVDEAGHAQGLVRAGKDGDSELSNLIRPKGLTMQVMRTGEAVAVEDRDQERERVNPSMFRDEVSAAVCLPLSLQGKQIGAMWLHYQEPRRFPAHEIDALQLYANQAAIAYDNARRMRELEHMRQAAEAMAGKAGVDEVLEQIAESARDVLGGDSAAIWSYDDMRGRFIPKETKFAGIPAEAVESFRKIEPKESGTARTVMERGWLGVVDIRDPATYDYQMGPSTRDLLASIGARSFQGIALKVSDETLGVLYVNYNQPRSLGKRGQKTLATFAYHAALALKKARLLEQVRKAKTAAEVVARVTALGEPEEPLRAVAEGTRDAVGCDAVVLYVYDPGTDKLEHPPTMVGVRFPHRASRFARVEPDSVVYTMLRRDSLYIVDRVFEDALFSDTRFARDEEIKSLVAIPLWAADHKVGVMFVNYHTYHRFSEDELTNLELFSNQAAVAIQNAQLYQAEQHYAQALEVIQATSSAVSAILDLEELLPMITREAAGLFNAPASSLMLWDATHEYLVIRAAFGLGDRYRQEQRIEKSTVEALIEARGWGPHVFNIAEAPFGRPDLIEEEKLCTALVAPLIKGEELIGILCVYSRNEPRPFGEREEELAGVFANHAAIAIQNARLYDETNRRAAVLQALYEAGKAVTSTLTLKEILDQIVKQAWKLATPHGRPTHFSHLALVEDNRIWFEAANTREIKKELIGRVGELDLERSPRIGIVGRVVQTRKSQNVGDATLDPDYVELRASTRSQLAVPVVIGERVFGVINVEHPAYAAFDQEDLEALEHLAAQAAVAIQNARQYEELGQIQGLVGARTALAWMGMASSNWRHTIDGHAISIREQAQHLRSDLDLGLPVNDRLDTIRQLAGKILEKPITPPLSNEEGVESVPIGDLVQERLAQLWHYKPYDAAEFEINLDLEDCATVRTSPEWLRQALDALIDNAVEAMITSETKQVLVTIGQKREGVEISIADTGVGIPEDVQPKLMQEPIKKVKGVKGQGMGLLMAQTIVQAYGGEIYLKRTGPAGTTMAIWLPLEMNGGQEQGSDNTNED